jgi:hypothetical protein
MQVWYGKILARLDELFSELAPDDIILRVDRLELDLGAIGIGDFERDLADHTLRSVRESLEEQLKFGWKDSGTLEVIPVQRSAADMLLFFLRSGRLPWWSATDSLRQLETGLMGERPTGHPHPVPAGLPAALRSLIGKDTQALQRLVWQFSDPFLGYLLKFCFPAAGYKSPEEELSFFKADPARFIARYDAEGRGPAGDLSAKDRHDNNSRSAEGERIKETNAPRPATEEAGSTSGKSGPASGEARPAQQGSGPIPAEGRPTPEQAGLSPDTAHPGDQRITDPAGAGERPDNNRTAADPVHGASSLAASHAGPGAANEPAYAPIPPRPGKSNHRPQDEEGIIYTGLAGLVILHPFLTDFFAALHLLEDKTFMDEAARHKAVHLLGYLGLGEEETDEPLLAFPKMLCGMQLSAPTQRTGNLTAEEREEAGQLLDTVIRYWTALKSTSPAGLRDSFLKRQGKLSRKDGNWQLDVEKKTLDVLLGKLPWGYSIVKLPWMKELLFVNWGG